MNTEQNSPAEPVFGSDPWGKTVTKASGLTAREHAAIALRVPDSGNPWLDEMIRTAQRNDLAARAMASIVSETDWSHHDASVESVAADAYKMAGAMLAEQAKP